MAGRPLPVLPNANYKYVNGLQIRLIMNRKTDFKDSKWNYSSNSLIHHSVSQTQYFT